MQLRGVRTLNFANNKLSGELPAVISQMRSLRTLDLSGNQYSGRLERLCALRNLEVLSLKGNNFEGALPACFRSLTRLRILDLTANRLSGDLSNMVSNMRNLGVLLVAGNQFTGKFPALSTLRSVDVTGVKFTSIADIPKPRNMNLCVVGSTELCTDKLTPGSLAEFCNVKTVCGGQQSPAPSATESPSDIAQATPSQATAQPPAEEPVAATPSPSKPEPAPTAESTTPPAASADQSQPAKSTFLTNTSEVPIIIATAVIVVAGFLILTYLNRRADKSNTDVPETTTTKNIPSLGTSKNNNNRQSHGSLPVTSFRETMMSIPGAEPYSFSMSDKEGFKASVRKPYLKSQEDEVTLNVNDEVTVESTFEDGWCLGMNITTGESGYFPLICLK
ncbi:hypothetical protein BKA69DRAFT_651356 [Paraphysoderma sedebokerense]|nr:hypothetical protein BKA69DRAFT_651356 [Paraphysoderma sedebokerense]